MSEISIYIIIYASIICGFLLAVAAYFICDAIKNAIYTRKIEPLYKALINLQTEVAYLKREIRRLNNQKHNNDADEQVKKDQN